MYLRRCVLKLYVYTTKACVTIAYVWRLRFCFLKKMFTESQFYFFADQLTPHTCKMYSRVIINVLWTWIIAIIAKFLRSGKLFVVRRTLVILTSEWEKICQWDKDVDGTSEHVPLMTQTNKNTTPCPLAGRSDRGPRANRCRQFRYTAARRQKPKILIRHRRDGIDRYYT